MSSGTATAHSIDIAVSHHQAAQMTSSRQLPPILGTAIKTVELISVARAMGNVPVSMLSAGFQNVLLSMPGKRV